MNQPLQSFNPYTQELIKEYPQTPDTEVNQKLDASVTAYLQNRNFSPQQRQGLFLKVANLLQQRRDELASLAVFEMGKTITAARAEVEKCELTTRYFAENIEKIVKDQEIKSSPHQILKVLPIGPVLAVMPWNFPYWQLFRAVLAALSTGNTVVLKHASNVSGCALAVEKIFNDAGWPKGSLQVLLMSSDRVKGLIEDQRIKAVTLTGSENAGKSVAKYAGENLKKTVLELGGSDPLIVSRTANVKEAALTAAKSRTINNGQSCIAAKRFIVEKSISKEFLSTFIQALSSMKLGDPMNDSTEIGPLVSKKAFRDLHQQLQKCIQQGGELLLEPRLNEAQNLFSPAVVKVPLTEVNTGVFAEELFGPVALFYEVENLDQAFKVANQSRFGLGSSFWSQSEADIQRALNEIEAGLTFINAMVASEPQLPFGGIKHSGYGRELGLLGPHEFANLKSVSYAQATEQKSGD